MITSEFWDLESKINTKSQDNKKYKKYKKYK